MASHRHRTSPNPDAIFTCVAVLKISPSAEKVIHPKVVQEAVERTDGPRPATARPPEQRVYTEPMPVWMCGSCGRRIFRRAGAADVAPSGTCKCGARHELSALHTTSVPGALWHRPRRVLPRRSAEA